MNNYYVYWIHLPEHTNKYAEGYIGITNDLKRRWRDHKSKHSKSHILKNAILKYKDTIIWEHIHFELTQQEASKLEKIYRPTDHIGWNIVEGGNNTPLPQSVKDKISKAHSGKVLTEEHKENIKKSSYLRLNPDKRYTGKGINITDTHKQNISKAKLGVEQPFNQGTKNGRFRPWYLQ
jgi:predicted GIY-YIG superfamily endonuclease